MEDDVKNYRLFMMDRIVKDYRLNEEEVRCVSPALTYAAGLATNAVKTWEVEDPLLGVLFLESMKEFQSICQYADEYGLVHINRHEYIITVRPAIEVYSRHLESLWKTAANHDKELYTSYKASLDRLTEHLNDVFYKKGEGVPDENE